MTDQNVQAIATLERAAIENCSLSERAACGIAAFCGSMTFVWIHVALFSGWIFVNTVPWALPHLDPFPFTFLTLVVSLEAIFLSSFILISQNQETRVTERRARLDLQINLLSEQKSTKILAMLEGIANKIGADVDGDPDLAVLEESMRPDQLVKQIRRASETRRSLRRNER